MYESSWWKAIVAGWEMLVYNAVIDLENAWKVIFAGLLLFCVWRWWRRWVGPRWRRRGQNKRIQLKGGSADRDLAV